MVKAKTNKSNFNYNEFMEKAKIILDELGQRPLVLDSLRKIIDISLYQKLPESGYMFSPINSDLLEFTKSLETVYNENLSDEEKEVLKSTAESFTLHSQSPKEFQGILGENPYFLNGFSDSSDDVPLHGLDDDEIVITPEERNAINKGGIPLGGLLVLYLLAGCLREAKVRVNEQDDSQ